MVNFGGAPHDSDDIQDLWYALKEAGFTDATGENPSITVDTGGTELNIAIQDFIDALEGAAYTDNLPQGGEHLKARGYGLQPDGDLVGDMASGQIFNTTVDLAQDEEFVSDWYDTDGFSSLEMFVETDAPSKESGVVFEFTEDVQQTTPPVDATIKRELGDEQAKQGFGVFKTEPTLDGFRFRYVNNSTAVTGVKIIGTTKTSPSFDGANYVDTDTLGNNFLRVGTEPNSAGLKLGRPTSLFGDLTTIERSSIIDISSTYGTSTLRDVINSTGSGTISQDPDETTGEIELSTGTTADSSIDLRTAEFGRYTPGYSAQAGIGIRVPTIPTEGELRWGYFDGDDGFYWGYDASQGELFVARRTNGTEVERVYRSNFNRNNISTVLDGDFNIDKGAIYQIDYSWYGYGIILFTLVDQTANDLRNTSPRQESVIVHAISVDNTTSVSDPNQPITVQAENGANGDDNLIRVGGRQFSVFGQESSEPRVTSQFTSGVSVDETAWTYVMSWRRDPTEFANSKIDITSFDTIQTGDTRYALVINPNLSGTNYVLPELTADQETLLQVSTTGSFDGLDGGTKAWESLAKGGSGNKGAGSTADLNINLGQDVEFAILARGKTSTSTVDATVRMAEDF
jgi:hypothetical protein